MLTATGSRLRLRRIHLGRRFRESYQTLARKQRGFYCSGRLLPKREGQGPDQQRPPAPQRQVRWLNLARVADKGYFGLSLWKK